MLMRILIVVAIQIAVALGDVPGLSCDFDNSLCEFQERRIYTNDSWTFQTGNNESDTRHPINSPPNSENFLKLVALKGRLHSPMVRLGGEYCVSLDYYSFGFGYGSEILVHIERYDDRGHRIHNYRYPITPIFVRNHESSFVDKWNSYQKTIMLNDSDYKLNIEGIAWNANSVALSNLKFVEGPCVDNGERFCDFDVLTHNDEPGVCDWLEFVSTTDDPWKRWRTRNPEPQTGARQDFTTRTKYGGYLQGMSSENVADEMLVRIRQVFYPEDGAHCWIFQHNTVNTAKFQVLEQAVGSNVTHVLFENIESEQSWFWQRRMVDIDPVVPIKIYLKMLPAVNQKLSLDSMKLIKGKCPKQIDCDFKNDVCGYNQRHHFRDWKIGKGRLPTNDTRLDDQQNNLEETYQDNYLYSASMGVTGENSTKPFWASGVNEINSDLFDKITPTSRGEFCCKFSFWYDEAVKVELNLFSILGAVNHNLLTRFSDERPWVTGFTDVKSWNPFRLQFKTVPRNHTLHFTTLKVFRMRKVELLEGPCANHIERNPNEVASPRVFEEVSFHCYQTGHYVPQYRTCDGVIDCPMGEDEGNQCEAHQCDQGGIPCTIRKHKICLKDNSKFCNGVTDCNDGIDEDPRLCNQESFCSNYCLNDGVCNHESFNCTCADGMFSKRCA